MTLDSHDMMRNAVLIDISITLTVQFHRRKFMHAINALLPHNSCSDSDCKSPKMIQKLRDRVPGVNFTSVLKITIDWSKMEKIWTRCEVSAVEGPETWLNEESREILGGNELKAHRRRSGPGALKDLNRKLSALPWLGTERTYSKETWRRSLDKLDRHSLFSHWMVFYLSSRPTFSASSRTFNGERAEAVDNGKTKDWGRQMGLKSLAGQIKGEKFRHPMIPRSRTQVWIIRATSTVLLWTCVIQLTALGELWGPRVLRGLPACFTQSDPPVESSQNLPLEMHATTKIVLPPKRKSIIRTSGMTQASGIVVYNVSYMRSHGTKPQLEKPVLAVPSLISPLAFGLISTPNADMQSLHLKSSKSHLRNSSIKLCLVGDVACQNSKALLEFNTPESFLFRCWVYKNNGYLLVSCNGGLNQMRAAICDMVAIARYLNVTLVVPELDKTSFWADPSEFKDIFDVDHFITSLRDEVRIIKELPPKLKKKAQQGVVFSMPPVSWSNISYYLYQILPLIQKHKVVHLNKTDARLANNGLPLEIQMLRCRVNFNALRFTSQIEELGRRLLKILHENGPFLVLHLRYEMDMLAFSGCTHDCTDEESEELTRMRYAYPWWKEKVINSELKRMDGLCPLTPEETAIILQALDFDKNIQIYIAAGEIYGGERRMSTLSAAYPNVVRKEMLLNPQDLRPFQNHSSQMAALDYLVSLESDVFVPTYDGNMAKVVEGHRRFLGFRKTILLDRKHLVELLDQYTNGSLSWDKFSVAVREVHAERMGKPTKRIVIPDRPKEEDYFYANPEECLQQNLELEASRIEISEVGLGAFLNLDSHMHHVHVFQLSPPDARESYLKATPIQMCGRKLDGMQKEMPLENTSILISLKAVASQRQELFDFKGIPQRHAYRQCCVFLPMVLSMTSNSNCAFTAGVDTWKHGRRYISVDLGPMGLGHPHGQDSVSCNLVMLLVAPTTISLSETGQTLVNCKLPSAVVDGGGLLS
eukprot:Gb_12518 [translate_table: standard]